MWYWNARGMRSPTAGGYAIAPTEIPNAYCILTSSANLLTFFDKGNVQL
ncbi:hypothetical protein [Nostoc sp. FACHB-892]|nr:hypothetical protein [Nostoc sp. FACHB-892]